MPLPPPPPPLRAQNYDAWEALGGRDFVLLYLFYIGSGNFKQRSSLHSTGISLAIHRQSELLAVAVEAKLVGRSVAELKRMMGALFGGPCRVAGGWQGKVLACDAPCPRPLAADARPRSLQPLPQGWWSRWRRRSSAWPCRCTCEGARSGRGQPVGCAGGEAAPLPPTTPLHPPPRGVAQLLALLVHKLSGCRGALHPDSS